MDGFINIVKYKQSEYDIDDGFDLEQLILLKRQNNLQFTNAGEPVNKFVYFDSVTKEYNAIFLYANEQGMIDQHVDYLTYVGHTTFPDPYVIQKYGPLADMDVKRRPISIPDSLLHKMRASLELGYLRFNDESSYNALNLDGTVFENWITDENVNNKWTTYPADIDNDKDFEYFIYETRGMALNIESNNINDTIPYGLEHYESDLKSAIATAKTSSFSSAFFDAITALGVTVYTSQF